MTGGIVNYPYCLIYYSVGVSDSSDRSLTFYLPNNELRPSADPEYIVDPLESPDCHIDSTTEIRYIPAGQCISETPVCRMGASDLFLNHTITSADPQHCVRLSAEPQHEIGPSIEPDYHADQLQELEGNTDPLGEPITHMSQLLRSRCPVTTVEKPGCQFERPSESIKAHEISYSKSIRSSRGKSTESGTRKDAKNVKNDVMLGAFRSAAENSMKRIEMDQAFHNIRMSYLQQYHQQQMEVLQLEKLYWEKKITNEGL